MLRGTVSWNATSARAQVSALAPGPLPSSDMTELEVEVDDDVYYYIRDCINNGSKQKTRPKGVNLKVH